MFHRESLNDWCNNDTLCKLSGNHAELRATLDTKTPHFMHSHLSTLLVILTLSWMAPISATIALIVNPFVCLAQTTIDPPNWWGDLEEGLVEVLISNAEWGDVTDVRCQDDEVVLEGWRKAALPGHVWVALDVHDVTSAREVDLKVFRDRGKAVRVPFGVTPSLPQNRLDAWQESPAMYLIMPDRCANGDAGNDDVAGMLERGVDRTEMYARMAVTFKASPANWIPPRWASRPSG